MRPTITNRKFVQRLKASRCDFGVAILQSAKEGGYNTVRLKVDGRVYDITNGLPHAVLDLMVCTTFSENHVEVKGWGDEIDVFTDYLGDRVRRARNVRVAQSVSINVVLGMQKILGVSHSHIHQHGLKMELKRLQPQRG
jgi:hypothetical protein